MFIYWLKAWELLVYVSCSRLSIFMFSLIAAWLNVYALDLQSFCSKEGAENPWLQIVGFEMCGRDWMWQYLRCEQVVSPEETHGR